MVTPRTPDEVLQQTVDAISTHGSLDAAARILGIPRTTMQARRSAAERRGFKAGTQRMIGAEPTAAGEGYRLKGTSTLVGKDGEVKLQWIKTQADQEALERMQRAAFQVLCEQLPPIAPIAAPAAQIADLLTLYTITDSHVGMLAWDKESGEDWDLNIAEKCLVETFVQMIDAAPASAVGVVNQLGDFLHFDSLQPMTPTNHHILDADSRYQKMVEVAVRILRRVIEHALTKHARVQVFMHEGNHDPAGSVWLRVMFAQLYKDNPRVEVGMSPNPYVALRWGKVLLGFHHGHLVKLASLPQIFAAKFREEWGTCPFVYVHTGHRHHVEEKEHPGVKVIQHPTLAAADAYAARGGWLSKRQATSMTYHKERGEIARGIFIPN